nr:hypothetical protein [Desulfonema ishimotonii]
MKKFCYAAEGGFNSFPGMTDCPSGCEIPFRPFRIFLPYRFQSYARSFLQEILVFVIIVNFITIAYRTGRQGKVVLPQQRQIGFGSGGNQKLNRFSQRCGNHMNSDTEKISAFARNIPPELLTLKDLRVPDADIVTDRNGKTVCDVFPPGISVFENFGSNEKQGFPYIAINSAVKSAFAQNFTEISVLFQETGGCPETASEKSHGCKDNNHHFRIVHFYLTILTSSSWQRT